MNQHDAIKLDALIRLGLARQAKLDKQSQEVYLDDLDSIPAEVVVQACLNLRRAERAEFETAFPALGNIIAECKRVTQQNEKVRRAALIATLPKEIAAPADWVPPTKEEAQHFIRDFKARVLAMRSKRA